MQNIQPHNLKDIDPTRVYEIIGPRYIYHERRLSREQVCDKVFKEKAKLEKDGPDVVKMHRKVVDGKTGKDVAKWEAIFKLSASGKP